jgi:hypothetical protein
MEALPLPDAEEQLDRVDKQAVGEPAASPTGRLALGIAGGAIAPARAPGCARKPALRQPSARHPLTDD